MLNYQPRNVLITGGAGFIGSHYIRHCIKNPQLTLINLDLLTYAGTLRNLTDVQHLKNYHFVRGNINDKSLITELLETFNIDTIVHFAAESHVDRSILEPDAFIQTNIVGTFNLLNTAFTSWEKRFQLDPKLCRFHHISTDEVYGSLNKSDPAFTEESRYDPSSPYSASKASSDHLVKAYFKTYNLPVTLSNCSNNYGPYQHEEKLIPTIIRSCLQKKEIPIYGDGQNIRDWLYVEDHCEAISEVIQKGQLGETYNIGGNNELCNLDLAKKICQLMNELYPSSIDYQKQITFVKDRLGHDWRYAINSSKITNQLNWSTPRSFETCLKKTILWYIDDFQLETECVLTD